MQIYSPVDPLSPDYISHTSSNIKTPLKLNQKSHSAYQTIPNFHTKKIIFIFFHFLSFLSHFQSNNKTHTKSSVEKNQINYRVDKRNKFSIYTHIHKRNEKNRLWVEMFSFYCLSFE